MTESNLTDRIRLRDGPTLEFKRIDMAGQRVRNPDQRDLADELAAMANGRGGTMLLGIDEVSRAAVGIPTDELDVVEGWVREICNDTVKPALDADIRKLLMNDPSGRSVPIIRIDLARSLFVHRSPGGYFRRIGRSKREMAPDELARLIQERSYGRLIRFDETIVPGSAPSDLHYMHTQRFARDDPADDALRKLWIVAIDDDGEERLTIAGVLLCTPEPQKWLPHAYIQAVSYAGECADPSFRTDSRDVGGPLDRQVGEALRFVKRNMMVRAAKMVAGSERPQFSERAVFEALVNAVAHRDYSLAGTRIRLHLFEDRLELYVPGALASSMTTESLHLRQSCRNELVVSLLARCRAPTGLGRTYMMDWRGDGVPMIREECERLSGHLPEYSVLDESELRLVIRAAR